HREGSAWLESPSHALQADANPYASSASTICITLAEKHRCDRNLEIILYPCEPHHPHLITEHGAMTYQEYAAHIRNRQDYARIARKGNEEERQVAFVQKRFHKDIFHNPVLMLNFCPEVGSIPTDFQTVTREMLFLVDRSGRMRGSTIDGIKDALLVAVKSLPSGSLLNVAGFGSNIKPIFPSSKPCNSETLRLACEYIQRLRADMGGTNLLAALAWMLGQPLHRGFPRQLFLFTNASVGNTGKVIELVRRQASSVRCFTFGLGSGACERLLKGLAKVSRGRAEFLSPGERLQPKLMKSLKKAIEPAVSDITIDWYVPDTMEALLSPNEIAALYPGDRLISYCTLYHIASFRDKKSLSRGSTGSVFPSQDDALEEEGIHPHPVESQDLCRALHEISVCSVFLHASHCKSSSMAGGDPVSGGDIWKRIYRPSYIQEQYVLTHCSVSTDQSQGLLSHSSTSSESTGSRDVPPEGGSLAQVLEGSSQQGQKSVSLCSSSAKSAPIPQTQPGAGPKVGLSSVAVQSGILARAALSGRSFSSPHGELDAHRLRRALEKVSQKRNRSLEGKLDEIGPEFQKLRKSTADSGNLLSPAHLDWDTLLEPPYLFSPSPATEQAECQSGAWSPLRCQVVIHALSAGKPVSWEVTVALDSLLPAKDSQAKEEPPKQHQQSKGWDKLLHRLTAGSVIRDNENVALRESPTSCAGFSRRFRLKAVQASKACHTPSIYTSIVPVDSSTQEMLPSALEVRRKGRSTQVAAPATVRSHRTRHCPSLLNCLRGASRVLPAASRWHEPQAPSPSLPPAQVHLQEAPGMFQLTEHFSEVVQIPLDRLRRASPYASHRASLSPASSTSPWVLIAKGDPSQSSPEGVEQAAGASPEGAGEPGSLHSRSTCSEVPSAAVWAQADSGRGSETEEAGLEAEGADLESTSWATAVALAWLEHRCAGFFVEWELLAAKADAWLRGQRLPEGVDVAALKGAARQLFLLLRHWDENIKLNMLCYDPSNV
uniref:von Willebrand factor A domain containing 5B2 n=1 Tax=Varanus komodoensis TaxID=61221 RepID=A0A8D2L4A4_VARKO